MQATVFEVLVQGAGSDDFVKLSKRDIAKRAGCSMGNIQCVLDALMAKARIEQIKTGIGSVPTMYRINRALVSA
jgi:hypothetical protein